MKGEATVVKVALVPMPARGKFYFLKEMGAKVKQGEAIRIVADDAGEAKKIQSRWRAYFKDEATSRKVIENDEIVVYLARRKK